MLAEQKIKKAIESCQRALENLHNGNKRIALGDLDYVTDKITAAKWILINEIDDENKRR